MSTYVINGASRGIGFEFLRHLSNDPAAVVIGLARNKEATEKKVAAEISGRTNIHIFRADLQDYASMKNAAQEVSTLTNGSLDYLIASGAVISSWSAYDSLGDLASEPEALTKDLNKSFDTNVVGNIHLFNLFMPLILKGSVKKVIALSSGHADPDLVVQYDVDVAAPYTISKAALNMVVAKYSATYRSQGVLFLSISPGVVDTSEGNPPLTDAEKEKYMALGARFRAYAPHWKGPITTEQSVTQVVDVINKATIDNGYAGAFVSHLGNKQWL